MKHQDDPGQRAGRHGARMNPLSFVVPFDLAAALTQIRAEGGALYRRRHQSGRPDERARDAAAARWSTSTAWRWTPSRPTDDGGLRLGALARNAATAYHPLVLERYPLLSAAILAGASPQIRNMASNGGNLLQRTRCHYFYDVGVPCNKREPGSGCPAIGGISRQHAILGASDACIATHPSDMCVALRALDAVVHVASGNGERAIPFAEFHRLPGDQPEIDTTLAPDELITHIALPAAPQFAAHSAYLKLRERASYAFALVSVAAMLDIGDDGVDPRRPRGARRRGAQALARGGGRSAAAGRARSGPLRRLCRPPAARGAGAGRQRF